MFNKPPYRLAKHYRIGVFCFLVSAIAIEFIIVNYPLVSQKEVNIVVVPKEIQNIQNSFSETPNYKPKKVDLHNFNPNTFTQSEWAALGLSQKQINTLFNYKNAIGGFKSKQEIKKCYAISDEFYLTIAPYILLPESNTKKNTNYSNRNSETYKNYNQEYKKKPKVNYQKFNPNIYKLEDWMKIGFSKKQAQTILKYKNKVLGGNFSNLEEINNCYAISDQKFAEIKPYIVLSKTENTPQPKVDLKLESSQASDKITKKMELKPFKINDLTKEDWLALGFSSKQIKTIFNYKKSVGGKFTSLAQFKKCYVVSEEKFNQLKPYILFD